MLVPKQPRAERIILALAAALGIAFVAVLVIIFLFGHWPFDAAGRPRMTDFVTFWTAGQAALHGHALAAYDPQIQHAAEVRAVGHEFSDRRPWSYPPIFFFPAVVLGSLSFAAAFALWNLATLLGYAAVTASIAQRRFVFFASWSLPWAMLDIGNGQTGLLVAALAGLVLANLERRPALAGILLGILSFKPQLGLLVPIALVAGGYWRALAWAVAATMLWTAISCIAFGPETLFAFVHNLPDVAARYLVANGIGWQRLQSVYGLARWLGASHAFAFALQVILALACVAAIAILWRSGSSFALKAAGLAVAMPLATPYVLAYDLCILSIALAFLLRHRSFAGAEYAALATVPLVFLGYVSPAGLVCEAALAAVILKRCLDEARGLVRTAGEHVNGTDRAAPSEVR
jgi:hypothetical protein